MITYMHTQIHIHTHTHTHTLIHCIYIYRERESIRLGVDFFPVTIRKEGSESVSFFSHCVCLMIISKIFWNNWRNFLLVLYVHSLTVIVLISILHNKLPSLDLSHQLSIATSKNLTLVNTYVHTYIDT